jgi:hypothetical protein
MYRFVIACVLALTVALVGTALTKTPDGQPPSEEDPCDGLNGSAYGICNAYCEAQDCDVHPRPSCERLRTRFERKTGSSQLPCDRVACADARFPQCDGDCPDGQVCISGPENGGPENGGSENGNRSCSCRPVPCGAAAAPECAGECPRGLVCFSGPENGGPENGGSENGNGSCSCQAVPCGNATAPECSGVCPQGSVCLSGGDAGPSSTDGCACFVVPCFESGPTCNGECPPGGVCTAGPEGGGGDQVNGDCVCIF